MLTKIYGYEDLAQAMEKSGKPYDVEKIHQAFEIADQAHQGQRRRSGEAYVSHPVAVACQLVELGMDTDTVVAGLLHDVIEDTNVGREALEKQFGAEVVHLVDGVTKLGKIPYSSREEQQAENVRKMLLAMAQDVRVIIIKLADRLHNMRTLEAQPEQKRRDKSLETMEIYAPLAHRLGMTAIKEELEDTALRFLDPVAYEEIEHTLRLGEEERMKFLESIQQQIYDRVKDIFPNVYIKGRIKSIYGIYRKLYIQGKSMEEIYDIYAVRLIVDTVDECYHAFGIIHEMFQPLPNRFKDYISTPKSNLYQSLHTTVIDKRGIPFEVQIRTWDMHHMAEYGIAAHWKYKAGIAGKDRLEERLAWIRQLLEVQKESDDAEELLRSIKSDLSPEEIYVFTPKGDVINLPTGATVIDFAYAIHTEVGNRMVGAKINGRMVALDTVLHTGNIIEIVTSNAKGSQGPSRDWLKIVKTAEARNKIRSWFKKERREENIQEGRTELEREFRRNLISLPDEEMEKFLLDVAKRYHFQNVDDFLAAIGYGGVLLSKIMPRVKEDYNRQYRTKEPAEDLEKALTTAKPPKKERGASSGVIVEGIEGCLVKFARCCNPLPGDDIIGFITRGYGVSIHKRDCVNVTVDTQPERWVQCHWANVVREKFKSSLDILATDRGGIIADVSIVLSNMHVPIHSLTAKELKNHTTSIQMTIVVNDLDQLQLVITNLRKINGVLKVKRNVQ